MDNKYGIVHDTATVLGNNIELPRRGCGLVALLGGSRGNQIRAVVSVFFKSAVRETRRVSSLQDDYECSPGVYFSD